MKKNLDKIQFPPDEKIILEDEKIIYINYKYVERKIIRKPEWKKIYIYYNHYYGIYLLFIGEKNKILETIILYSGKKLTE